MKNFINKLIYYNRNMSFFTKLIIIIIMMYFILQLKTNIISSITLLKILILLFSLISHEIAHGFIAYLFGDNTAKKSQRLSLNPLNHLDPVGTIFPILLILTGSPTVIGWAKPVPINYYKLKGGRFGEFCVAIAGILTNLFIAMIGIYFLKYKIIYLNNFHLESLMFYLIFLNLILAIFNSIPIPPLDGSRILASIVNEDIRSNIFFLDKYGIIIIFVLSWIGVLSKFIDPVLSFLLNFMNNII